MMLSSQKCNVTNHGFAHKMQIDLQYYSPDCRHSVFNIDWKYRPAHLNSNIFWALNT